MSGDETGPRFGQLTFTTFDDGRGPGGWRVKDHSPDLTPDELKELEAAITTQLATTRPVPRFPTPEEQDALPRRLLYAPAACGGAGYWHSTPAGLDATGRPGNVFVHVVLDRRPEVPEPAFRPSDLWRSRGWLTPFGHSQVLAAVPAGPPPWPDGVLDRARVLDFLFEPGCWRVDVLVALLDAVAAAMRDGADAQGGMRTGRLVVLGTGTPEAGAWWIAAVTHFMSAAASRRFHFSTLESPSHLPAVAARGVHLVVVPTEHLEALPAAGHVVLREDEELTPALLGGEPHRTQAGSTVEVTPWSVIAREVLVARETAERTLALQDDVAAAVDVTALDPAWALAMAVAQIPELGEVHGDAATLVREAGPVDLRAEPGIGRIRDQLISGTLGVTPADLLAEAEEAAAAGRSPDQAWTFYLEYTIGDDDWLQRPGGVPLPPSTSRVWRHRGSFAVPVRERFDRMSEQARPGVPHGKHALLALRLADVVIRSGLHDTAAGDAVVQSARTAVRRAAAVALLDPGTAPDLLTAVGPFGEPTQRVVVRPALEDVVASSMRRRGERVPPAVLRWLYPEPPSALDARQLSTARPRDALLSEIAAQVTNVVAEPSAFVLQALSDALADLPAVPAPTLSGPSRGTAEVERLLAGRSWGPAALRALVGRMSRSPALQETMLRLVLTHRMDDDLADLLTDLDETTRTWSSDGGRGSDGALRGAVQLCRLADTWWRGPESESASHAARGLVETVEPLLDPLAARGLPVTEWREQLAGSVVAATAVATVCRPDGEGSAPLDQRLLHADIDHHEAVRLLDRALSNSVLSEVELVLAALGGAPDYPLAATVPASVLDLGRTEVTADGQRGRLLELVVRRRADRQEMAVHDVNERVLRLVGYQLLNRSTVHEADQLVSHVRNFAQHWWARLGVPVDVGAGGPRFLRRWTGQ